MSIDKESGEQSLLPEPIRINPDQDIFGVPLEKFTSFQDRRPNLTSDEIREQKVVQRELGYLPRRLAATPNPAHEAVSRGLRRFPITRQHMKHRRSERT